jgi:HK97 family phage portal protein
VGGNVKMNLFKRIFGIDRLQRKAVTFTSFMGGIPVYSNTSTTQLVNDSYNTNIDFFAVIKRISSKFGHIPRYVITPDKKRKSFDDNIIENDLSKILIQPNDNQGQDTFFELICASYLLTGEAFIWKNRGGFEKGRPLELFILPSSLITVYPDKEELFSVAKYEFDIGGTRITIPVEDMIHWKAPNPTYDLQGAHLRGFNPLIPQRKTIQQSNDVTDASVAMFQNGGAKGVLYNEGLDSLDEQQQAELKAVMDRKINNKYVKASVAALQGKWGYLNLGLSSVDMQMLEADEMVVKKICNANGLPYELFQSDTTFANKKEAWNFFITNTLMPLAASLDGELNRALVPDFGKGFIVATDFNELPEMQAMRLEQAKAYQTMWELTPNERRELSGFERIVDKNMDKIYMPSGNVPLDEAGMGELESDEDTEKF